MHKNDTKPYSPYSPWDIPLALVLLTRLPLPRLPDDVFKRQAQAAWAFPVAGLVVGALACLTGWAALALGLPLFACAGLVTAVLIATTGAMHEDGLADTFDGLWGGYSPERRLEIMKDSHIGAYGVLALILSQLVRVTAIAALLTGGALIGVLVASVASRALMPVVMAGLPNARQAGLSHSVGVPHAPAVLGALALALILTVVLVGPAGFVPLICAGGVVAGLAWIARSKIGGQTGDILGASQQLAEITILLALAARL